MQHDNDERRTAPTVRGALPLIKHEGGRWLWYVLGSGLTGAPRYEEDAGLTRLAGLEGSSERAEARSGAFTGIVENTRQ